MMKELESLKAIAGSQLAELHNTLRDEREQKHIYKQQLDHRIEQVWRHGRRRISFGTLVSFSRNPAVIWIRYV